MYEYATEAYELNKNKTAFVACIKMSSHENSGQISIIMTIIYFLITLKLTINNHITTEITLFFQCDNFICSKWILAVICSSKQNDKSEQ